MAEDPTIQLTSLTVSGVKEAQDRASHLAQSSIAGVKKAQAYVVTTADHLLAVLLFGRIMQHNRSGWCRVSGPDLALIIIHSVLWRFLMHILMLVSLLQIAGTLRSADEMFLTKHVMDTFVSNHFDSSHNTFLDLRRPADVFEWGNNVLWPGLMDNNGPCDGNFAHTLVGVPDGQLAATLKAVRNCTEGWADGAGSFHLDAPTPWSVAELAATMDDVDWTEGITIRTLRVKETEGCSAHHYRPQCRPEIVSTSMPLDASRIERAPYGYKYVTDFTYLDSTATGMPLASSSHIASSDVQIPGDGYLASVRPFFSERWLPETSGRAADVPFDLGAADTPIVTRTNGKTPRYVCVRISRNAVDVVQLCDPNQYHEVDGVNRTTGVVRAAVEAFWNDLKRSHFLDLQTRAMVLTLSLRSNNMGVTARANFLIETTAAGAVLPSFEIDTVPTFVVRENRGAGVETGRFWRFFTWEIIALVLMIYFCHIEVLEIYASGVVKYCADFWNFLDLLCFVFFFIYFSFSRSVEALPGSHEAAAAAGLCTTQACTAAGVFDSFDAMYGIRKMRDWLAVVLCLGLLKTIKFVNHYAASTSLLAKVLARGRRELVTFTLIFAISLFAFAAGFWVRFGSQLEEFSTLPNSFRATCRALFGDYDLDAISNQYHPLSISVVLFLIFCFVNIFIVLSIFLAILGEAQARAAAPCPLTPPHGAIREAEEEQRLKAREKERQQRERQQRERQSLEAGARPCAPSAAPSSAAAAPSGGDDTDHHAPWSFRALSALAVDFLHTAAKRDISSRYEEHGSTPEWMRTLEPAKLERICRYQLERLKAVHRLMSLEAERAAAQGEEAASSPAYTWGVEETGAAESTTQSAREEAALDAAVLALGTSTESEALRAAVDASMDEPSSPRPATNGSSMAQQPAMLYEDANHAATLQSAAQAAVDEAFARRAHEYAQQVQAAVAASLAEVEKSALARMESVFAAREAALAEKEAALRKRAERHGEAVLFI